MKGQIEKRTKGTYRLRLFLGRDENGKRQRLSKTVHGTKKEAERALREWIDQYESGRLPTADKVTFNQWLAEWLEVVKKPDVSARTYEFYRSTISTYISKDLGRFALGKLTALDIYAHRTAMNERGFAPKTVRHVQSIISDALKCAARLKKIAFNPAADVQRTRTSTKKKHPVRSFDPDQLTAFLLEAQQTAYAVLFELAVSSGMRPQEYLGLGWSCVDWARGGIRVERAAVFVPGQKPTLGPPKTASGFRTIPLPKSMMARLREHRQAQVEYRLSQGGEWSNEHDLVFPSQSGGFMDLANLRKRVFKPILERANLWPTWSPSQEGEKRPGFRLYDLRHTCATLLLVAGENPKVVQERLGHSSITQTLDTYSHVLSTLQKGAADKLEGLVYGGGLGGQLGAKGTELEQPAQVFSEEGWPENATKTALCEPSANLP